MFWKKSDEASSDFAQIPATIVAKKLGVKCFWPKNSFPNLFLTQNTLKTMINLPMTLKKPYKNHSKKQNKPENKNQPELIYVFSWTFKVKNTYYELLSSNRRIWHKFSPFWWPKSVSTTCFSLYRRNLAAYLCPLSTRDFKIRKINFCIRLNMKNIEVPKLYNLRNF
jgi:hypothetical protein